MGYIEPVNELWLLELVQQMARNQLFTLFADLFTAVMQRGIAMRILSVRPSVRHTREL